MAASGLLRGIARTALLLLAGMSVWPSAALAAREVAIVLSEPGGIHAEAAQGLAGTLKQDPTGFVVSWSTADSYAGNHDLTVAIGTKALSTALANRGTQPVLSLLVPRQTFERLTGDQQNVTALFLDQPLDRQLRLLKLALPDLKKVAVPFGPYSSGIQSRLELSSRESDVAVRSAFVQEGARLYGALTSLAEDCQAFLLLPDPLVVQRNSLHNFFLHTYRLKRPVLAYSAPLVDSGALLGLYATPSQLGEEAGRWIRESWAADKFRLGASRYPTSFTVRINQAVARSLELALPAESELSSRLEKTP